MHYPDYSSPIPPLSAKVISAHGVCVQLLRAAVPAGLCRFRPWLCAWVCETTASEAILAMNDEIRPAAGLWRSDSALWNRAVPSSLPLA